MPLTLIGRRHPLHDPSAQLALFREGGFRRFEESLASHGMYPLTAVGLRVLQMNLGKMCNQTCKHCHVDAGPDRREIMTRETMAECLRALSATDIPTVDLTGGAPELNPHFRWLVEQIRGLGRHVMDRCNLTILLARNFTDLPEFLAGHRVEVVASLPFHGKRPTDSQRGEGVFEQSIEALRRLNGLGYGEEGSGLVLNLVYNPVGAFLPGNQGTIEGDFRRELDRRFGIRFNRLFALTNMPINRFLEFLVRTEQYEAYMERLVGAYNPEAAKGVMCRTTLSVGWDGRLHDCDFNQQLELSLGEGLPRHISEFDAEALAGRAIRVGPHCYGCTAGAGSSCGGAVAG